MELYLIRHTTPEVARGTCYGQSDIPLSSDFLQEASTIKSYLPSAIGKVYSSPLRRCSRLAEYLFPSHAINLDSNLMEIHCGDWEMRLWDEIPQAELEPWMNNFVGLSMPGGESYLQLYSRVRSCFEEIFRQDESIAIITHGGVIRSILSHITETPLEQSFQKFSLHYGCVVKLSMQKDRLIPELIFNNPPDEKEMHKPGSFSA
jgi:alpha-ribazole phosphatase